MCFAAFGDSSFFLLSWINSKFSFSSTAVIWEWKRHFTNLNQSTTTVSICICHPGCISSSHVSNYHRQSRELSWSPASNTRSAGWMKTSYVQSRLVGGGDVWSRVDILLKTITTWAVWHFILKEALWKGKRKRCIKLKVAGADFAVRELIA